MNNIGRSSDDKPFEKIVDRHSGLGKADGKEALGSWEHQK